MAIPVYSVECLWLSNFITSSVEHSLSFSLKLPGALKWKIISSIFHLFSDKKSVTTCTLQAARFTLHIRLVFCSASSLSSCNSFCVVVHLLRKLPPSAHHVVSFKCDCRNVYKRWKLLN